MANSQFQIFQSSDGGAPTLNGTSGSLIAVLDYCLTGSTTGWTRTFTSSSSGTVVRAMYQQASGSRMFFNIQDDALLTSKEARIFGFETGSSQDTGSRQFPLSGQGVPSGYGYVVTRKSTTIDATARAWIVFADTSTVYFFCITGDSAGTYTGFFFGDIYSLKGPSDAYRCIIAGRTSENAAGTGNDTIPVLSGIASVVNGHYMARTYGGGGSSITVGKHGDGVKGSTTVLAGTTQYPNGVDGTIYMAPIWVHENASSTVRGRLRGWYQICHAITNFTDGDTLNGSSTLVGRTFQLIKTNGNNGIFCLETSATVETN